MRRTGVFLTPEELARIREDVEPRLALTSGEAVSGNADRRHEESLRRKNVWDRVNALARAHGLPDARNGYGLDTRTGELLAEGER